MTATIQEMKKEEKEIMAERDELEKLIKSKKKTKAKIVKEKKAKVKKEDDADMVDWVEGVFIFRDQPGAILPFTYKGQRVAIRDGEIAQITREISDHLNGLIAEENEWVHREKDSSIGEQGTKRLKQLHPRTEFRVTRSFKQHKSIKMKKPERHKM